MTTLKHLIGDIFALVAMFGLIGVIYPTKLHKKLKLTKRWMSLIVFFVASMIAHPLLPQKKNQNHTEATSKPAPVVQTAKKEETKPAHKPDPEAQYYINKIEENSGKMADDWKTFSDLFSNPTMDDNLEN